MRQPKDIRECVHYWANMVMPQAKCGNVRFDGPVLYSYAEPIGLLLPNNRVLISNRNFSPTTSSHQTLARVATNHMRSCSAPYLSRYYHDDTMYLGMHKDNRAYWERQAEYAVAELKNHPRRKKSVADKIASDVASYNNYREFFELDWHELDSEDMKSLVEFRAAERAETEKLQAARRDAERKARESEEAQELENWRVHLSDRRAFSKTALRLSLDGQEIETTRGARVPVDVAKRLWTAVCSCREHNRHWSPSTAFQVGVYMLTRIDADGTLHVGCHTIPFDELELMAKKLNFIQENSNGIESDRIGHDADICSTSSEASARECCSAA